MRRDRESSYAFIILLVACLVAGCAQNTGTPVPGAPPAEQASQRVVPFERVAPQKKLDDSAIKHVVIIVQENRSFDNLFQGFPGADTQSYGYESNGQQIQLGQIGLETNWDIDHSSSSFFAACNGLGSYPGTDCQMNGFNNEDAYCGSYGEPPCPLPNPMYAFVPHTESAPYFAMGEQYALADRMFASNFDASSFISHQYIISGQANSAANYPSGEWGCDGGYNDQIGLVTLQRQLSSNTVQVCWNVETLGDELDAAGLSWRYYTASLNGNGNLWSAYQVIRHIRYGPDWNTNIINPQTRFFRDVRHGRLATVSWVTPTCQNSDHAGCGSNTGPSWVAALVNSIGHSQYWKSTVIFVMWDDYGGWYDHVPPQFVDYDGLGIRVPLLVISAYAKDGYVSHQRYEHGSILRFIEDRFGLPRLAASDERANSPDPDCFDFSKPPRTFVTIPAPYHEDYFMHQPPDRRVPDAE